MRLIDLRGGGIFAYLGKSLLGLVVIDVVFANIASFVGVCWFKLQKLFVAFSCLTSTHYFSLLFSWQSHTDEEIVVPKGSDEKFVAKLNQIFDENNATKSVYFTRQRRNPLDFTVRHFAGMHN